jgi:hypothetical protein
MPVTGDQVASWLTEHGTGEPLTPWQEQVLRQVFEKCPSDLALCGVPCGCGGRNPSHRRALPA